MSKILLHFTLLLLKFLLYFHCFCLHCCDGQTEEIIVFLQILAARRSWVQIPVCGLSTRCSQVLPVHFGLWLLPHRYFLPGCVRVQTPLQIVKVWSDAEWAERQRRRSNTRLGIKRIKKQQRLNSGWPRRPHADFSSHFMKETGAFALVMRFLSLEILGCEMSHVYFHSSHHTWT